MSRPELPWYELSNPDDVASPALLVFPNRVESNMRRLITMAGGVECLRPHVKTHKMADVVRLQLSLGISRFKCATVAEAEMLAAAGAPDAMLAYPLVGPQIGRALQLSSTFPATRFSFVVDNPESLKELAEAFAARAQTADVYLDLNLGMDRTGMDPSHPDALELYRLMSQSSGARAAGLHAYDGHIADTDIECRTRHCDESFAAVQKLVDQINGQGLPNPSVVAGGTPTFPIHVKRPGVECSPGTCVFWDFGYADKFPDLEFDYAAVLMTRVVSRPTPTRVCLDLGYKAVAADQPSPRVRLLNDGEATFITHNEEHLVFDSPAADEYPIGTVLYAVPRHICPTVALYHEAFVVDGGQVIGTWPVTARDRRLTI